MKTYVIPAYNEAGRIGSVLKDLIKINLPIIVVDDGSSDNTNKIIQNYNASCLNQ